MGTTYTAALHRDERRRAGVAASVRVDTATLLLAATSLVAVLALTLASEGRLRRPGPATATPIAAVDLGRVTSAEALEPALGIVRDEPAARRAAAQELYAFLATARAGGDPLPNVAAILRATGADGRRLFTAGDLAALKPHFTVRSAGTFGRTLVEWGALYLAGFYAVLLVWRLAAGREGMAPRGDVLLLAAAHLLTAIGFAALVSRADPLRDTLLFVRFVQGVLIGLACMAAASLVNFRRTTFLRLSYLPLVTAFALSILLIVFGDGPGTSGAKVNLGPVQPIEAIRLLLALFLAGYFARRWELLRHVRETAIGEREVPSWLRLPRLGYAAPLVGGVLVALAFFFLQKDLGPALFLSCVFLALYAVARGGWAMAAVGSLLLAFGFSAGYRLHISDTLAARVAMWQSPWDNAVRGGDQVAQSVWALATGGLFGSGFGLGETRYLPAGHTDLALAAVGEELGLVGLVAVALVYAAVAWRGFRVAIRAADDYGFFLALAVTLFLIVPVLLMAAGLLGVVPLTGVVTPFLSYGGSAMAANFAALGALASIGAHHGGRETAEPFVTPMRYLSGALAFVAVLLAGVLVDVQLVHADAYAVKAHLSLQADGVGRYQYNPRVLDLVRELPRGNVLDRAGRVLATGDPAVARQARGAYQKLGVAPNGTCVEPIVRCYPLGGAAFHLLGDATTRENWGASNTSYVERDAENRLRGFDDHAAAVKSSDAEGHAVLTVRRDYAALVPLLRHRYERDDDAVKALLARDRDVRTTIDARLQLRVARILADAARHSSTGRAAAVVLDPATGDVLALASHPYPTVDRPVRPGPDGRTDMLLDRSRYGLYPPGSTFKLVTAAAALRQDPSLSGQTFTCGDLPDGRVGARIPGHRTVRDDILDQHAHGTIDMRQGLVLSCNAYFAQLAMKVGPEAVLDAAAALGISVASGGSIDRLRATLPQAGYGQADVVATPLRMARVAAALANDGVLVEPRVEARPDAAVSRERLLSPAASATLARYMRDAVVDGTGRTLRQHPQHIAGKTGTAEVAGADSHSWFVGFAPYEAAPRRIAFAVIVENAGYGGLAAANAAGSIVTAAAETGVLGTAKD